MTSLRRPGTGLVAAVLLCLWAVTACGGQASSPAPARPTTDVAPATGACAEAVDVVDQALSDVVRVEGARMSRPTAAAALTSASSTLQSQADRISDDIAQQSVQDLVDALHAYLAVLPQPSLSSYRDVAADLRGRLTGFRRTCPVDNASFAHTTSGWVPATPASELTLSSGGHAAAPGLLVTNGGPGLAAVGVMDSPSWVDRTWAFPYRVGLWARAATGSPVLTLDVRETRRGSVVGSARAAATLGPGWTFVGLTYVPSGGGGPLSLTVSADGVGPGATVELDELAVARG